MHWTAILAKRAFPTNARVVDDLPCVSCGYNLRHQRADARCPECSMPVGESLYLLRRPEITASAVHSIATSYAGLIGLPLLAGSVVLGVSGLRWIGLSLLVAAALFRVIAVAELRFRAALRHLPLLGERLTALWWLSVVELSLGGATLLLQFLARAVAGSNRLLFSPLLDMSAVAWVAIALLSIVVVGWVGQVLGSILGYEFIEREFRVHRWLMAIGSGFGAIYLAARFLVASGQSVQVATVVAGFAAGLLALAWTVAMGFLLVALLHLSGGAQRATETLEEILVPDAPPGPATRKTEELPTIKLAEKTHHRGTEDTEVG
ncbi:MAG: hypothetical protein ACYTGC_08410 [Planctomycetota bacterium]|jgi:hypothetical protein